MTQAYLSAFGALFARHAETLVGSEDDPKDPGAVAKLCYLAGFVYVGFLVFCGMQVCVQLIQPRG
jgi:ribonuclease kappa